MRFFNDLLDNGSPGFLHTLRVFYDGDTYISLPGNFKFVDQIVSGGLRGGFSSLTPS